MLYPKNLLPFDPELFRRPTAEYRGTPFWAWNCVLEKDELLRQIEVLKEMGFGGFHMHSRAGMATTYLSPAFMDLVRACTDKAKAEKMLSWLYDEDRWPSGAAGGYVTKDPLLRAKRLCVTPDAFPDATPEGGTPEITVYSDGSDGKIATDTVKPLLIAVFDIVRDDRGALLSYKRISADGTAEGKKFYFYLLTSYPSGWYNGQAYVDTMSSAAIRRFIDVTYTAYRDAVGSEFGATVPAIFTDEPQIERETTATFGRDDSVMYLPWTWDFADTFRAAYGFDIVDHLPELRWDNANGAYSRARYCYHDHVTERFTEAFSDQCGAWCKENGILLTGHMDEESTLESQTHALGEAMRCYRGFGLPGIDMLCNATEFSTAKQAASAVHQYGREGMMSELYGVTSWYFDFRGHKFQGDWQAALGVTVRVPHLSWVSMKGSAKRDYPASINYQSPWYKEYKAVEDHFARVATVLTRGKPVVRVGVIHPIESTWLVFGPHDASAPSLIEQEERFQSLIRRLLFGTVDFDFISESLLPSQYGGIDGGKLAVGEMRYETLIVPELLTIRKTTLDALSAFLDHGGNVIFIGDAPEYVDAVPSDAAKAVYSRAQHVASASLKLLNMLSDVRDIRIENAIGDPSRDLLYQLRREGDAEYLFIAHGIEAREPDAVASARMTLYRKGLYAVTLLDTATGEEKNVSYRHRNGETCIDFTIYASDSFLFRLTPTETTFTTTANAVTETRRIPKETVDFRTAVPYKREEDNVCVLDIAEWSEDGEHFNVPEEVLRIDERLRAKYKYPHADGHDVQPWVLPDIKPEVCPVLRFSFDSEIEIPVCVAVEEALNITLNGDDIPLSPIGYYVDKSIKKYALPALRKGKNVITVRMPLTPRIGLENGYLLGDFDVRLSGCHATICAKTDAIAFGSVTEKGLPFYGGNIRYRLDFDTAGGNAFLRATHYRGALLRVFVDGRDCGTLIYSPYEIPLGKLAPGHHTAEILLYGNRGNTFSALHNTNDKIWWYGHGAWYTVGTEYSYDYRTEPFGILYSPVITVYGEDR